ncbi:MAG TPA: hypothetical protein VEP49_11840 [Acidimicrobiia bacterium]|nr:hypothetical protein [Acidimicrobiia bacterium]
MADDDARDERLAGLLDVEPLDDLSRRRLVSNALSASAPPAHRTARLVVAAALVAAVVAGGITYLALRGGDSSRPTAARVPRPPAAPPLNGASKPDSPTTTVPAEAGSSFSAASPRDLGDLGDLRDQANLDRARALTAQNSATAATSTDASALAGRLRDSTCAASLPGGTIVAVGTAHFGSRDAIVAETQRPDGSRSLDAVLAHPCEVRSLN